MKKIFIYIFSVFLVLPLLACKKSTTVKTENTKQTTQSYKDNPPKYTIEVMPKTMGTSPQVISKTLKGMKKNIESDTSRSQRDIKYTEK